jgi:hypothetical protein
MTDDNLLRRLRGDSSVREQLLADLGPVPDAFDGGRYALVDRWPYPPGPGGPLVGRRDSPAHGAYVHEEADELVLCVANNGWPIDVRRCPGPNPGSLAYLDATSSWVSQQDTLLGTSDPMQAISAGDAALDRVVQGHKPLAMTDTASADEAVLWQSWSESAGLVCHVEDTVFRDCGDVRVWFVTVARSESFGELVDLDAVCAYYEAALPRAGGSHLVRRVLRSVAGLRGRSPAEFTEQTDGLIMAPFGDDIPGGCCTEVAGVVMGCWPPTTAAFLLSVVDGVFNEPDAEVDLRAWDALRFGLVDEAERYHRLAPTGATPGCT